MNKVASELMVCSRQYGNMEGGLVHSKTPKLPSIPAFLESTSQGESENNGGSEEHVFQAAENAELILVIT